ncbi:MAG: 2Fe-2S iron-sulfur cluster binding domain-containing protein [Rhodospirillaceae bacterium]|jgi:adenylate cyclase|nr:2Fe-2S iron-sulfur cluster binding domain-containing protein [Rhodospirillaceae bacterium]MBT5080411.1 2Fe-2S iron-sulfur cluster binding domain-containing protein [Rhodospirillaceae bacterium]MBT5523260.1 2Fe-2S iron-sulfur cluster binding domain-containing protein [Rhodospirillaceae bacterium]MBT5878181.1 2Fe-2S iron-sulfur cluster binding domain-containing protein [Rhodospirillaceae bacterium]MBT6910600.1 2Fe-2S iron-sulfur cluster binding domain-containing protein [Rhodospirillaceae bact
MGSDWARKLRLGSGLVLFAFVATHFINHALGNISLAAMEAGAEVFLAVWRNWPATILLYGAGGIHIIMSLVALWQRRTLRMSRAEGLQIFLALAIPFLLPAHILATRGGHEFFGIHGSYLFEILSVWVFLPQFGWVLAISVLVVWGHGCIGMHHWLRLRPWYGAARPWLLALALLLPGLALTGFTGVGKQVAIWAQDKAWLNEAMASFKIGDNMDDLLAFVYDTTDYVVLSTLVIVALLLLGRWLRSLLARRGHRITIAYPDGHEVAVEPGLSVLDASRLAGIAHASVCGGHGRCSTCRVRIAAGLADLPPANGDELKVLARVGAPDSVRLACQLRPTADVTVMPLLPPNVSLQSGETRPNYLQGSEREIAVLFADLRAFTKFSESKLPYDVVFALNQYFRGMGQAVESAGGHLDKFIGDGVMALFGVESDLETGCRQALAAAAAMAEALEHLNHQLRHDLDEPLRMGIGVHAGATIVGEMGYGAATSVTAIGDTVNTASRLEAMTKEFTVQAIVSDYVAECAAADLGAFEAREVTVRGRAETMKVYLVPDARSLPHREVRAAAPKQRRRQRVRVKAPS